MSGIRGGRPRMGGHGDVPRCDPASSQARPAKKRVLFVCIGNSCRSQMAEAFARAYGSDVMEPYSAGLAPAALVAPMTRQVLREKNVGVEGQFPKALETVMREPFDIIVNMSGTKIVLPLYEKHGTTLIEWPVPDPIGQKDEIYRIVAAQIEGLVMRLILELRTSP